MIFSLAVPERMSRRRLLAYALGNPGFTLTDRIVVVIAIYFYLPPPGRGLEAQIPEAVFLGFLTAFGLAMQVGRVVDSLADPLVGHYSDSSRSRRGRRRSFLIAGVAPMVGVPVLLFWPPGAPGSVVNAVWLGGLLAVYFVFFTVYVAPYLALIPEIAWSQKERVKLSRLLALTGFPVMVAFGFLWPIGIDVGRVLGLTPTTSLRLVVVFFSAVALALCVAPITAVDEVRFTRTRRSDLSFGRALAETFRNRAFMLYLGAQLPFIFGITLIQPALPYMATVVLGRSEGFAALLGSALLLGICVGFFVIDRLVARLLPKRTIMLSVGVFCVPLAALGLLQADVPGGPNDARNLVIAFVSLALAGFPLVSFLIVPHVILSQLIDEDEQRTGANRSAIFFGVQGFLTKWVYGAALWALTYLLSRFGNSPEEPLGVLLVGPVAGAACLVSFVLYALYPEHRVLASASRRVSGAE